MSAIQQFWKPALRLGDTLSHRLLRRAITLGVDGGYFGDDYGAQRGLLFSPKLWRQLIKPRLATHVRCVPRCRPAGDAAFRRRHLAHPRRPRGHRPDLPESGSAGSAGAQAALPRVRQHITSTAASRPRRCLPKVSPAEVRAATLACMHGLAPDGTGLILGPSHRMQSDIPPENVAAMLSAFPAA